MKSKRITCGLKRILSVAMTGTMLMGMASVATTVNAAEDNAFNKIAKRCMSYHMNSDEIKDNHRIYIEYLNKPCAGMERKTVLQEALCLHKKLNQKYE